MNRQWRLGLSSGACGGRPIGHVLPAIRTSGVTGVEIGTSRGHFAPSQPEEVAALASSLAGMGLAAVAIHAPFGEGLDLADVDPRSRQAAVSAIVDSARAIGALGGSLVVVHPSGLERQQHVPAARLDDCVRSLETLTRCCEDLGVRLVVETPLPHLIGGRPEEFSWLLGRAADTVGVCLDTGHVHLIDAWQPFLDVAGARLCHVHVHDNRGSWDDHLPPGEGHINWAHIAATLTAADYEGWLMLELACPPGDLADEFAKAIRRTAALFEPVA